ncbi:hypothetical protein RJ40_01215 [Methanofollis aquaemaris]|uniref:PGF-CTERM sorting domain-containing protein n=1 Tax=Methanofollis aquaemaris TaxID=126734 RepID=A0A8A3S2P9_9EURY|nr:hypothetical protein RJ40_01215 [Methanofollis aquaemaris]
MTLFLCICLAGLPTLAGAADVERTLSTPAPEDGSVVDVTLSIEEIAAGGVIEHLPPDFVFAGSTLPADRVAADKNQICFALLNETSVTYQIVAPDKGGGEITGEWYDFVNRLNGTIQASRIGVDGAGVATTTGAPGPAPALIVALLAGLIFSRGRRQ